MNIAIELNDDGGCIVDPTLLTIDIATDPHLGDNVKHDTPLVNSGMKPKVINE